MLSPKKSEYLYLIQIKAEGQIKIGKSTNPKKRLKDLQSGSPYELRLLVALEGQGWREKILQTRLKKWVCFGEWFSCDCLQQLPQDISDHLPSDVCLWRHITSDKCMLL